MLFFSVRLFCVTFLCIISQSVAEPIVLVHSNNVNYDAINNLIPKPVIVNEIEYTSDVWLQKEEFFYLLGFSSHDTITASDLTRAAEHFIKKNKFKKISVNVVRSAHTIHIAFFFEGIWSCNKIKIQGVYYGKQELLSHYLIESGHPFDNDHHKKSLKKIQQVLIDNGYYDAQVTSTLVYDTLTKNVNVNIIVQRGRQFSYGTVGVQLITENGDEMTEYLRKSIEKRLTRSLTLRKAKRSLLNHAIIRLRRHLAQKGFLNTIITLKETIDSVKRHVTLEVTITAELKRDFIFYGNSFFSHKQLLDMILEFDRSASLIPSSLLAQEIMRIYKTYGFWDIDISVEDEKNESFFVINEGARAHITKISISGSHAFDNLFIINRCFATLLKHSAYDEKIYNESINAVYNLYAHKGFVLCEVVDHHCTLLHDNEYELTMTIDEHEQIYIDSIAVEGYPELINQGPFKQYNKVLSQEPVPINSDFFEEQRAWLVAYFQKNGFLHPQCNPVLDITNGRATVVWKVEKGEHVRFGKTIIVGSNTFPFSSFLKMLCYEEGELWEQEKMRQTLLRFKELELFDIVHLTPDYSCKGENKTIIAKLREDDTYEIRARAGLELQHVRKYQTFNGITYKIGGTALAKNPFNCGDQLRFDCDFAKSHKEIVGLYKRPFFLHIPCAVLLQAYFISYKQPGFIESANDIYSLNQRGFFAGFQHKSHHTDVGFKLGFEYMSTNIKNNPHALTIARAIDFDPRLIDRFVPFFFIEPGIVCSYLDNPFNPSRGTLTILSMKAMIPLKEKYMDTGFFKIMGEQSFFIPIYMSTCALRVRLGHIFRRTLSSIMPSERFYLGGSHSVRGYEIDLAPPISCFVDDQGDVRIVPRGGQSLINVNAELRIPLLHGIGGVLFQDGGALSSTKTVPCGRTNVVAATGFGFRFFTPFGPLRFDIGWRWKKELEIERSFAWFLTFGQAF